MSKNNIALKKTKLFYQQYIEVERKKLSNEYIYEIRGQTVFY